MRSFVLLSVLIAGSLVPLAAQAGPVRTEVIYTNKLKFRIPFHYDNDELRRLAAKEIQLSVSRNRGQTWKHHQSVPPEAGKFNFEAPSDGEYWFIVRTVDGKNRLHPDASQIEPGLQVIVDTTPPRLELELKALAPGKAQLAWTAADEHLDLSQLRIEYLPPGSRDWQQVSIVPSKTGRVEPFSVPHGGNVAVRGYVSDLARNVAHDEVSRAVAPGSQTVPRPASPIRQPVAGAGNAPFDSQSLSMSDEFPGTSRPAAAGSSGRRADALPVTSRKPADDRPGPRNSFVSQHSDDFGEESMFPATIAPRPTAAAEPAAAAGAPRRRVVNTRKFQMGYKLQELEGNKVEEVELYVTQNGGAQWYHYGADDDRQSPVMIQVPQEGTYGFALGVRTADGQSTDAPRLGDAPSLEVVVDETPPRVELLPPETGRGRHAGRVLIQWKYSDDNPDDRPVTLSYATGPRGPWRKITDWSENSGRYVWTVDAGTPAKYYLRITARDQAGNEQTAETLQPIVIDHASPTAQAGSDTSPN